MSDISLLSTEKKLEIWSDVSQENH